MKINFYLPQIYRGIAGGYKVVYQYANFLAERGHNVCIYYDLKDGRNSKHIPRIIALLIRRILFIGYPKWFVLDKKIKQFAVKHFDEDTIGDADVSVATAPSTAYDISKLSKSKGIKFYFIQGYENWDGTSEDYLHNSYKLGLTNIVISKWLSEIIYKYSKKEPKLIENGIDLSVFKEINCGKNRDEQTISMIYHDSYIKGCVYGIEALKKIKKEYPNLKVIIFSGLKRPSFIPNWMEYKYNLNERQVVEILNKSTIFLCTSLFEGFGLPGLECMACGCALITTKCKGPEQYATEKNSILCETKSSEEIYKAIKLLLDYPQKRKSIVKNASETIKKWDFTVRAKEFEKILETGEK